MTGQEGDTGRAVPWRGEIAELFFVVVRVGVCAFSAKMSPTIYREVAAPQMMWVKHAPESKSIWEHIVLMSTAPRYFSTVQA